MVKSVSLSMKELSPVIAQCIENGSEVILTVTGNSMSPFLRDRRDQVVLVRADSEALNVNDVPLYVRRNGKYVLHRIVAVNDGVYTMLGDAQVITEPGIESDQIVAVAKAFIRKNVRVECDSAKYKRYVAFWNSMLPVRRLYFKTRSFTGRVLRKLKSLVKNG